MCECDYDRTCGHMVPVKELGLGDVVIVAQGDYGTATVYQLTDNGVRVWRPYLTTSDFAYGKDAKTCIPYIGIEDFELVGEVHRYRRGTKKG